MSAATSRTSFTEHHLDGKPDPHRRHP
jgi:hypothetical protein